MMPKIYEIKRKLLLKMYSRLGDYEQFAIVRRFCSYVNSTSHELKHAIINQKISNKNSELLMYK